MMIEGTYAAVVTPRDARGRIDEAALRHWLEYLIERNVQGFAINGATGEFCLTTPLEFERLMAVVAETIKGRAKLLAGVGAAGADAAIQLARMAFRAGADTLLLPMPYFFSYSQDDLKTFCRTVAAQTSVPVLLYNLPQFSTGLEPVTSLDLIRECDVIVGIKDSSGSLDTLRLLTGEAVPATRLVGNDGVLTAALSEGVADGVVSGVACVLPELINALWNAGHQQPPTVDFAELDASLQRFIGILDEFPTPWGLKIAAEARALAPAWFPFPLTSDQSSHARKFQRWLQDNRQSLKIEQ